MRNAYGNWRARARARMEERGMKQEDLLKPLGVSTRGAVGHYLSGRREPSVEQFRDLAAALGYASMDELLDGVPRPQGKVTVHVQEPMIRYGAPDDHHLVREVVKGVLEPFGLNVTTFDLDPQRGLVMSAEWHGRGVKRPKMQRPAAGRKTRTA